MTPHDNVEAFLLTFEENAKRGWAMDQWTSILIPILTGDPRKHILIWFLLAAEAWDYEKLKVEIKAPLGVTTAILEHRMHPWKFSQWPVTQRADAGADPACQNMATTKETDCKADGGKGRPWPIPETGVATMGYPRRYPVHTAVGRDGRALLNDYWDVWYRKNPRTEATRRMRFINEAQEQWGIPEPALKAEEQLLVLQSPNPTILVIFSAGQNWSYFQCTQGLLGSTRSILLLPTGL